MDKKKVNKKVYYRIEFQLISAMNIGSGENSNSDKDIMKNSKGDPLIPGTSMAGVYRSLLAEEEIKKYFGYVDTNNPKNNDELKAIESRVKIYDANLESKRNTLVVKRDGVGLDEYKTAKKGAKFDFEVIEPGAVFITFIEQDFFEETDSDIGEMIVDKWKKSGLKFGSKTMRGLGLTKINSIKRAEFSINPLDSKWLDFDMYEDKDWPEERKKITDDNCHDEKSNNSLLKKGEVHTIKIGLKQKGGISIRKYTTAVNTKGNTQPDYSQLTVTDNEKEKPLIPGTSWAGTFKHQMEKMDKDSTKLLFGSTGEKSKISFSETIIDGATSKVITRNAIDRFSGGTVNGALYTEQTYYGGNTTLTITIPKKITIFLPKEDKQEDSEDDKQEDKKKQLKEEIKGKTKELAECSVKALAASILDLRFGFMAVGGLTAVGRGLFEMTNLLVDGVSAVPKEDGKITEDNAGNVFKEMTEKLDIVIEVNEDDSK